MLTAGWWQQQLRIQLPQRTVCRLLGPRLRSSVHCGACTHEALLPPWPRRFLAITHNGLAFYRGCVAGRPEARALVVGVGHAAQAACSHGVLCAMLTSRAGAEMSPADAGCPSLSANWTDAGSWFVPLLANLRSHTFFSAIGRRVDGLCCCCTRACDRTTSAVSLATSGCLLGVVKQMQAASDAPRHFSGLGRLPLMFPPAGLRLCLAARRDVVNQRPFGSSGGCCRRVGCSCSCRRCFCRCSRQGLLCPSPFSAY